MEMMNVRISEVSYVFIVERFAKSSGSSKIVARVAKVKETSTNHMQFVCFMDSEAKFRKVRMDPSQK